LYTTTKIIDKLEYYLKKLNTKKTSIKKNMQNSWLGSWN
jgi:hypothetical protein